MHRIRVTRPRYEQSRPYAGQIGEVIGHWGAENNRDGRLGYLVEFPDGHVVGVAEDETEDVLGGLDAPPHRGGEALAGWHAPPVERFGAEPGAPR